MEGGYKNTKRERKFTFLGTFFLFFLLWKCWGTIGWLAQSEKIQWGIVAPLTTAFLSSHILLISSPRPPWNQLGRLAAHSFVPTWQSAWNRNQFATFKLLPDIINHLFVFFCYVPLPFFLCTKYSFRMPNVTSINPSFVSEELSKASIKFFLFKCYFYFW